MASNYFRNAAKGVGARSLDLPVAGLAGLSAGFVLFSLPSDLLEGLVGATGLASFLSAAQPPLGNTARVAVSLAGAAAAFGIVYLILRLIDRVPAKREPEEVAEEVLPPRRRVIVDRSDVEDAEPAGPRLRRADMHPDAPSRRPIFALSDLGEPEAPRSPLVAKPPREAKAEQSPFWLPDDFPDDDPEEAEAWMEAQEAEAAKELAEQPVAPQASTEPKAELRPAPAPEPAPEPEPEPEPELELPEPEAAPAPVAAEAPAPEPVRSTESITELMARLERGLSRRLEENEPAPGSSSAPAAPQFAAERDDRLKSAIDSLQRIAARGL